MSWKLLLENETHSNIRMLGRASTSARPLCRCFLVTICNLLFVWQFGQKKEECHFIWEYFSLPLSRWTKKELLGEKDRTGNCYFVNKNKFPLTFFDFSFDFEKTSIVSANQKTVLNFEPTWWFKYDSFKLLIW